MNSVYAGNPRREWINIALLRDQCLWSVCFQHTTCIPEALSCHFPSYVSWGHFAPNHVPCLQCWLLFDSPNCYSFFNMNCAFRIWTLWDHSRTNIHRCAKLIENILIVVILIFNGYIFSRWLLSSFSWWWWWWWLWRQRSRTLSTSLSLNLYHDHCKSS